MASGKRCYYEVLEVSRDADDETIKKSYRRLAMKFHPDRNPGDQEADVKFKEVSEAYDVLRDSDKRERYNRFGHAGVSNGPGGPAGADVGDIIGDLFGDFFGRRQRGPQGGRDLQTTIEIDLVDA